MPIRPDAPLRKVTLNLYHDDVIWLKHHFGQGYSEKVRLIIHDYRARHAKPKRTVEHYVTEDLDGE